MSTCALAADAGKHQNFEWQQVTDNVWFGISPPATFISGNTVIVKIPGGAFVIDPHITASTAREIIEKAKEVAGPVKYLVNTHLHNDHSQGNSAFREAFPDIHIVAHKNTCWGEREKAVPRSEYRIANLPGQMVTMRQNLDKISDPKLKADLERIIVGNQIYLEDSKHLHWAFPDVCLDLSPGQSETYTFGSETIQVGYYGRAHTAGDVVVYLPKERIVASGDLWSASGSFDFGRDGSGLEYPGTLKRIAQLNFDTVLPGHGGLLHGKSALEKSIQNSQSLVDAVKAHYARAEYLDLVIAGIPSPAALASTPAGTTISSYVPYMSGPASGGWTRNITRAFEEIELRKQLGLQVP